MIKLFRISKTGFANDLTGTGARLYGGRWNDVGYPVVYTSESRSLASLEYLVHIPMALAPDNLSMIEINVPQGLASTTISTKNLPKNWREYPAPPKLREIGTNWIKSNSTPIMYVPSSVVDKEYNVIINPLHPQFSKIKIVSVEDFSFDSRLFYE